MTGKKRRKGGGFSSSTRLAKKGGGKRSSSCRSTSAYGAANERGPQAIRLISAALSLSTKKKEERLPGFLFLNRVRGGEKRKRHADDRRVGADVCTGAQRGRLAKRVDSERGEREGFRSLIEGRGGKERSTSSFQRQKVGLKGRMRPRA